MKKTTVEHCEQIGISTIVREQKHYLFRIKPKWNKDVFYSILSARLESIHLGSSTQHSILGITLTSSTPHFGGVRYWFSCPKCSGRVGKLYRPNLADKFACRHCHNLTYLSTQTHNHRVNLLSNKFRNENDETLKETVAKLIQSSRGTKLLTKAIRKRTPPYPPSHMVRYDCEKEAYNKYVKPLLEN